MELTVCKFGGTSLANVENIKKVCDIVNADLRRRIIVVSAPGKRHEDDTKITDLLFRIHELKEMGENYDEPFNEFAQRFYEIEEAFGLKTDLREILTEFHTELADKNSDFITSTGEYFMAKIMAAVLGFEFVNLDKTHVIVFDKHGNVDLARARVVFEEYKNKKVVIPGFYGVMGDEGYIKTFPRGGSDITGAIIANIADATLYENWTDVDGVYDMDPRLYHNAKHFSTLSYDDIEKLTRQGAKVLHHDCIDYVRVKGIPIHLKNTFNPEGKGTIIK